MKNAVYTKLLTDSIFMVISVISAEHTGLEPVRRYNKQEAYSFATNFFATNT